MSGYPRARVRMTNAGELLFTAMHRGKVLTFVFIGGEAHSLASATVNAINNPGAVYEVSFDEKTRSEREPV
jgi:hypothetical protein